MNVGVPTIEFRRRRLPHWLVAERAYFVTLCRKRSLPARVAAELRAERARVARDLRDRADDHEDWEARRLAERQRRFLEIDAILDAAARSRRDLCVPEVSAVILGNLDWLRGRGWRIWAATLMPSHMHLVMRNTEGRNDALCSDLALFMSWTARQANARLGAQGSFWQPEPFDHWCRDADAWLRSVGYTLHNPVKAGLCAAWRDWPHTVADPEVEGLVL